MDVFKVIKKRYSCRSYQDKLVEEDVLKKILEAGRLAPSAHNAQDWKLVVVRDREKRENLAQAAGPPFVGTAPVVIAAVSLNPT
ncbi:nitroreductase, partial [Patescibacteria group bacterium]